MNQSINNDLKLLVNDIKRLWSSDSEFNEEQVTKGLIDLLKCMEKIRNNTKQVIELDEFYDYEYIWEEKLSCNNDYDNEIYTCLNLIYDANLNKLTGTLCFYNYEIMKNGLEAVLSYIDINKHGKLINYVNNLNNCKSAEQ